MIQRLFTIGALTATCLLLAPLSQAQQVYKWKDAHGVTQYSSTPPPKGTYSVRSAKGTVVAEPGAAAKATENPACARARSNLEVLKANQNVQVDSDGDGKPDRTMSADEHAAQTKVAEAQLASPNCSGKK